jgi:hypothetical protein
VTSMDTKSENPSPRLADFQWLSDGEAADFKAAASVTDSEAANGGGMTTRLKLSDVYGRLAELQGSSATVAAVGTASQKADVIDEVLDYQCRKLKRCLEQLDNATSSEFKDDTIAALIELRMASMEIAGTFQNLAEDASRLLIQGFVRPQR